MDSLAQFWSIMGIIAVLQNLFPPQLLTMVRQWLESWQDRWKTYKFFRIPEYYGSDGFQENGLYNKVNTYVSTLGATVDTHYANLYSAKNSNDIFVALEAGQIVEDSFLGVKLWWINEIREKDGDVDAAKSFILKIRKKDRVGILKPYLEHVQAVAEEIEHRKKELKLYTNSDKSSREKWTSVAFKHPATFDTIALDGDLKNKIKMDLETFARGKQYYHRLGRAWKRGYLLYGPPGTGKSSMIAAMANFLHYNVYDLELTKVSDNSELRLLLMQTSNKSILVIEDIDCSMDLSRHGGDGVDERHKGKEEDEDDHENRRVTLSGMLNFIDGLWSCCGEERIIVFTTNNKDRLDPALLRPGRMDMHIFFPYCTFPAFKLLANNYLGIKDHKLFPHIEESFQAGASMTPAEIGEILLVNKNSPSRAMKALINALQSSTRSGKLGGGNGSAPERTLENGGLREGDRSGQEMILRKGSKKIGPEEMITTSPSESLQEDRQLYVSKNQSFGDLKKLHNLFKTKNKSKSIFDSSPVTKEP
eukprot:Gb_16063 [translate_table: standard]